VLELDGLMLRVGVARGVKGDNAKRRRRFKPKLSSGRNCDICRAQSFWNGIAVCGCPTTTSATSWGGTIAPIHLGSQITDVNTSLAQPSNDHQAL
jgi:hypothetical protein